MSSSGSPLTVFRRAVRSGSSRNALLAAAALPRLDLADALALCLLLRDDDPRRYGRAAARWQARAVAEAATGLEEAAFLATTLSALRVDARVGAASDALRSWCASHDLSSAVRELDDWRARREPAA